MELFDPAQGIQLHQSSATWSIIFLARTPQAFARASLPRCIVVQPVLLLPRLLRRRLPTQTQTPQAVKGASLHRRTSGTSERVPSKSKPAQVISLTEGSHATVWSAVANHAPQSCSAPHFFYSMMRRTRNTSARVNPSALWPHFTRGRTFLIVRRPLQEILEKTARRHQPYLPDTLPPSLISTPCPDHSSNVATLLRTILRTSIRQNAFTTADAILFVW